MPRGKKPSRGQSRLPENFSSLDEFWAFWDTHSTADYEDAMECAIISGEAGILQGKGRTEGCSGASKLSETDQMAKDPDRGMVIRPALRKRLLRQKKAVARGEYGEPLDVALRRLK